MQKNKLVLFSLVFSLALILFLEGCASAKKKQCEDQNWFEYGKAQAVSGNHWNQPYYAECKKEGVNPDQAKVEQGFKVGSATFCNAAAFRAAGVAGDVRNASFCSPTQQKKFMAEYAVGLKVHCSKKGAFARGLSGKENPNLCPKDTQSSYNQFYLQGRASYFKTEIVKKEQRVLYVDQRLSTTLPAEIDAMKHKKDRYDYINNPKINHTENEKLEALSTIYTGNPTTDYNSLLKEKETLIAERGIIAKQLVELKLQQNEVEAQMMSFPVGDGALETEKSPN